MIIITNNQAVYDAYQQDFTINFLEKSTLLEVLEYCRNQIHLGAKLLTHPLTGSIKPNETPFKSVMIEEDKGPLDIESLMMIESAIEVTKKFLNNAQVKEWPQSILDDFRLIDFRLISSAIQSIG